MSKFIELKISTRFDIWGGIMNKEDYRKEIIEMVEKINRTDILKYIHILVEDIAKEDYLDE